MSTVIVRDAKVEDAERILEIYAYYIKNTAITFECEVPSLSEFQDRTKRILEKYPYIVIENNGKVDGYAYASYLKDREAYKHSCETSIYVDNAVLRDGLGRKLYDELEEKLNAREISNLYACIACPDKDDEYLDKSSIFFHEHMGYSKVGEFHKCGYKFDRWYNVVWMEKIITRNP